MQDQKTPSTWTSAMNHSEKTRSVRATPESYMMSSSRLYTGKKPEARMINKGKGFGTAKPTQKRLGSHRGDASGKTSASNYQTDTEMKNQNRHYPDKTIPKEHVAQSHTRRTRPLVDPEVISSHIPEDEKDQHGKQHLSQAGSSKLPRSRSQRQSLYRQQTDSNRMFQSLFKDNPSIHTQHNADPWSPLGSNPAAPYEREQEIRPGLHHSSDLPQFNLYHPGSEEFHCEGEQKQYKACGQEPCPAGQPDARSVQCATFNNQEFMGRLYQWEAFTEVSGDQRCALNCRPIGYRFYVRHTEKVQDGTPCELGSSDICVGGQCLSPGCDGILGSNSTLDTCGVCGGDSSTCKFITGTFKETNVPIGYHKILEIPKGATQISIRELTWSPNYLALRSRTGKSIINGNWAIDPPGRYEAGGTAFTYTQPGREEQEGESFLAAGPTTEALDVYMIFQQDNPGVSFQFFISNPPSLDNAAAAPNPPKQEYGSLRSVPASDALPVPSSRIHPVEDRLPVSPPQARPPPPPRPAGTLQRNIRIPPLPPPPVHYWPEQPQFFWKRVGNTPCSVTCGKGSWYPIFQCVSRSTLEEVGEEECDTSSKPFPQEEACNTQPCPAFWDVGNWSVCSRTCGSGIQHRQVLCRQMYANRTTMVHPQRCSHLAKPNVTQTCQLRICSHWEVQSNWTACSVMCGIGQKTRHVRCISNQGDIVSEGECSNRLRPRTNEVCDMGPCVRSWFHNDWSSSCSAECGPGIQRRSVLCLSSSATDESREVCTGTKPSDMRVCNSGPCKRIVHWYTGPWSQCSADCDEGSQRRDVICVSKQGAEFNITDPSECSHLEKPPSLQSCNGGPCGSRWFTTPWSTCSQSCLGGFQTREVRCLAADNSYSHLCDLDTKPDDKRVCNTHPCSAELDENCRDRYHNCAVVVQARLCVYAYYKQACCSSCSHSLQRTADSR
ncbi:ADAMTS-like protein 4 [Spea bombifrons]|uniref:ADAMTS-like protein 4 n=1 Tax=Spea bombifrons TaxID=233779 RepID=UPI00234B8E3C|nr:ADAMTS-like protein 4 [Spea bombifrons]